jgi:hypothetical protein
MDLEQVYSDRDSEDEVDGDIADFEDRKVRHGNCFPLLLKHRMYFFCYLIYAVLTIWVITDAWRFCWCYKRWEANYAYVEFICSKTKVRPIPDVSSSMLSAAAANNQWILALLIYFLSLLLS